MPRLLLESVPGRLLVIPIFELWMPDCPCAALDTEKDTHHFAIVPTPFNIEPIQAPSSHYSVAQYVINCASADYESKSEKAAVQLAPSVPRRLPPYCRSGSEEIALEGHLASKNLPPSHTGPSRCKQRQGEEWKAVSS